MDRFSNFSDDEIQKLLENKDADNTKRTYKVAKEVFYEYLNEKLGIPEPTEKSELAQVLKKFYVEARKKRWFVLQYGKP
jgi:argininosuccinate lyase